MSFPQRKCIIWKIAVAFFVCSALQVVSSLCVVDSRRSPAASTMVESSSLSPASCRGRPYDCARWMRGWWCNDIEDDRSYGTFSALVSSSYQKAERTKLNQQLYSSASSSSPSEPNSAESTGSTSFTLSLEKPIGLVLEEVEEGAVKGVKVESVSDQGSAYAFKDQILPEDRGGAMVIVKSVMGDDVASMEFDDVMDKLIDAPSPVTLEFLLCGGPGTVDQEESVPGVSFDVGTLVTINVIQEGKPNKSIQAKVGENLRKTLLDNNVEVYRGLKKKMGNCGGAGQCTFCAVDFVEAEGWVARSEYEDQKIGKWPNARLACLNNIMGPATIRVK